MAETGSEIVLRDTGEIVEVAHPPGTLFGTDDPVLVIERASKVASALADIIEKQGLFNYISGKKHVRVEGWTVLGSMIGVFPVLESCEPVEISGVSGFAATVAAQTKDGNVIGKATAYCMRNEGRWRTADTYAVASMAQTRATSKALRIPLGFVMQIAGYEVTPAEERDVPVAVEERVLVDGDQLAKLIAAVDANSDAPDLWDWDVVLANAERKFGRRLDKFSDLTWEEAHQIIEGAHTWRENHPLEEVGVDDIEFAPDLPYVDEQEV